MQFKAFSLFVLWILLPPVLTITGTWNACKTTQRHLYSLTPCLKCLINHWADRFSGDRISPPQVDIRETRPIL